MRPAHFFCYLALITASLPLQAAEPPAPPSWLDPAAPTRPLAAPPMATGHAVVDADANWQAANAAVARFARGHADIVRWEKSQTDNQPPDQAPTIDHAHPQHHGGQP